MKTLESWHLNPQGLAAMEDPEKYTRESFTFRRMTKWQAWSMSTISAALLLAVVVATLV